MREMTNDKLFELYDQELILRLHNAKNLADTRTLLARFGGFLGAYPPSPEPAKGFLAQYVDRKPRTLYRYAQMVKAFMKWYGQPVEDLKVKIPRTLPPYTEDSDVEKLFRAIESKETHKGCIVRDVPPWLPGTQRQRLPWHPPGRGGNLVPGIRRHRQADGERAGHHGCRSATTGNHP